MEFESNKLFVGGITDNTKSDNIREYFSKYGSVKNAQVIMNRVTGLSRGFGFVSFADQSSMQKAMQIEEHEILGIKVTVNVPRPIEKKPLLDRVSLHDSNRNTCPSKVFVGGLPSDLTKEEFDSYFETFGKILDSVIMCNKATNTPRGFGFVTYDSEESMQRVLVDHHHQLKNKWVEVKRAIPRGYQEHSWGVYAPCLISCMTYQRFSPNYGQPVWVNDPNFAFMYPSYYYYSPPFGQLDYHVNGNGWQRDDGAFSSSIAGYDNGIVRSVTIQEVVENGASEISNGETSCSSSAIAGYDNGIAESVTTQDEVEVVENGVSEKPNEHETSEVVVHVHCSLCGNPKVVKNGMSGTSMNGVSEVITNGNGVVSDHLLKNHLKCACS